MTNRSVLRRRASFAVVALALSAVLLAACTGPTGPAAPTATGAGAGVYRVPISDPGTEIDPLTVADYNAQIITGLVTEQLVSLDSAGVVQPRLATSWTPSADGLTWIVRLRDGVTFNDGTPVTPADVVATFQAITAENSTSPGRSAFRGILGSVAADGAQQVKFTLQRPFSDFPLLLTGTNTGILPAGYTPGTWLQKPVGAGQFLLKDYTVGKGATYVKNPKYWNAADIDLDGVELKVYGDSQAQLLAFQADEIDRISVTPDVAATVDTSAYQAISSGYNKFDGIFVNVTQAPFDDPKAREALAWAIDRQGFVDNVYNGNADVANDATFFPDYVPQPSGLTQRTQDLAKVAQLLGGRTLSFTVTLAKENQLFGEVLQQQLNAVPGFHVTLDVQTSEAYYGGDNATTPWLNAPVTVTNWAKRAPSQYVSLIYTSGAAWNASRYSNPRIEQLAAQFDAASDPAVRQTLASQIAQVQWQDVAAVIPAFTKTSVLQNRRVTGDWVGGLDFAYGYNFAGISVQK